MSTKDLPHRSAYITATGSFLPGPPVTNQEMAARLGVASSQARALGDKVLAANGIRARHYALDDEGRTTMLNEELAAHAVRNALDARGTGMGAVGMLAVGTAQPDLLVPGFASMVHGRLGGGPVETLSAGGVCCAGMAALKAVANAVRGGEHHCAVACASELVSRALKASMFPAGGRPEFAAEFLRWMLSDGAGAVVVEDEPRPGAPSLRIEWVQVMSHAHAHPVCMYSGALAGPVEAGTTWWDQADIGGAATAQMLHLRQDVSLLDDVVQMGVDDLVRLVKDGLVTPGAVDHVLCHYSSEYFRDKITAGLEAAGVNLPAHKWFTNLHERGNTGSASIFVMLDEAVRAGRFAPGDQVLLVVPESGRFTMGFALLTCVSGTPGASLAARLQADLDAVWEDFERLLARTPVVQRLENGQITMGEYRRLLVNLRQQVVEGASWICRAASNFSTQSTWLRQVLIGHAAAEQSDFKMLENDYVATGGDLAEISGGQKNFGSTALSSFIFGQASLPDPIDLLGAMFIIEGLGAKKAFAWAAKLQEHLALADDQVRFLRYHGKADEDHLAKLQLMISSGLVDEAAARRITRTARVTARLYALQLEEIDHV